MTLSKCGLLSKVHRYVKSPYGTECGCLHSDGALNSKVRFHCTVIFTDIEEYTLQALFIVTTLS